MELALIDYNLAHVKPSEVAVSGLLLAIVITNDPELDDKPIDVKSLLSLYWTDLMQKHTSYEMNDLIPTVTALANLAFNASEWKYKVCSMYFILDILSKKFKLFLMYVFFYFY